jgi:hypothetical protein
MISKNRCPLSRRRERKDSDMLVPSIKVFETQKNTCADPRLVLSIRREDNRQNMTSHLLIFGDERKGCGIMKLGQLTLSDIYTRPGVAFSISNRQERQEKTRTCLLVVLVFKSSRPNVSFDSRDRRGILAHAL